MASIARDTARAELADREARRRRLRAVQQVREGAVRAGPLRRRRARDDARHGHVRGAAAAPRPARARRRRRLVLLLWRRPLLLLVRERLALVPLGVQLLRLARPQSSELALDAVPGVLGVALRALVAGRRRVRRLQPRLQRLDLRRHALAVARRLGERPRALGRARAARRPGPRTARALRLGRAPLGRLLRGLRAVVPCCAAAWASRRAAGRASRPPARRACAPGPA